MHKPLSNISQLGRRGFLGLAGVAALSDPLFRRKRAIRPSHAKDVSGENAGSGAGSSHGLPPLEITNVRVIVTTSGFRKWFFSQT
jgi:hypothetical protein